VVVDRYKHKRLEKLGSSPIDSLLRLPESDVLIRPNQSDEHISVLKPELHLPRFLVDVLYNMPCSELYDKSTKSRSSEVWA